jgi:hypothetical protein
MFLSEDLDVTATTRGGLLEVTRRSRCQGGGTARTATCEHANGDIQPSRSEIGAITSVHTTAKTRQQELKKMGNHSMPSKQTLKRTVAAGAIAGCSAVGLSALSTVAAPAANACFFGCSHTSNTSTTKNSNNNSGVSVTMSQSNGNTKQSTGALSGNAFSIPIGLGVAPINASTITPITNVSALNGTANTQAVVVTQTTVTTNTTLTNPVCVTACS